ncbi:MULTISPECIES: sulfite exporter TauE/SafE family protein [unclassified Methanobrevibacter]|uniref:sulfite exporter TauE/SafE family protein n=1 Tax=unclassified Methanobrevibacter TaxID=2638681 RepID=UPI0039B8FF56
MGIIAGIASGLLGVGGGFIMVPLQFFLLTSLGVDSSLALMVSFGTSLAIIIPTSISGAYKHNKELKNILKPGIILGIFGIFGGFLGGFLASYAPTRILQIFFGIVLIIIAINMFLNKKTGKTKPKIKFNILSAALIGVSVGVLSGLLGIGGGVFIVTILSVILGFSMIESIGISSVFISLAAIGGVSSYIITGLGVNTLPYSLGYVSLVNFFVIILFSIPCAYIGANLSHKLPERRLQEIFAILLIILAIKMII